MVSSSALIDAIRKVAQKGIADDNGNLYDGQEVAGYVVGIHMDPGDELFGTVDVKEYVNDTTDNDNVTQGLHEGVHLAAINNVSNGFLIVPKMYSDVVLTFDSITKEYYVLMFSQVETIRLEGGKDVSIGVIEREHEDDPNYADSVDELEGTGNKAWTSYTKDGIKTDVTNADGDTTSITVTPKETAIKVGDSTKVIVNNESVNVEAGGSKITIKDGEVTIDAKSVKVSGGQLEVNGTATPNGKGAFCGIQVCPFTGSTHIGNLISGT